MSRDDEKLKQEFLEFASYCKRTQLGVDDGIEQSGSGKDYYNSEMWYLDFVNDFIYWMDYKIIKESRISHTIDCKVKIYEILKSMGHLYKNYLVGEVGRGLEIVLIKHFNPDFESIICYDHNYRYGKLIDDFFKDDRIKFFHYTTHSFDLDLLKPNTFMIRSHGNSDLDRYLVNKNIDVIISDGVRIK